MTFAHTMNPLSATYDAEARERAWQQHWQAIRLYAWVNDDAPANARANSYVIDTPPPTVSGTLHMGHVFSYTQADFIARYQRMRGKNVFYPMGFDDNGLPTERLVEKTRKIRAADLSREAFIAACLEVSREARQEFRALFESIALSVDWDQEYHTISDHSRRLSQLSFLDLVNRGHAYRALRPFYWDPVDQTAIASAEIVDKEMASHENVILFSIDGQPAPVMTTRPELLPACVALMYHPDDAGRYAGKRARTPLFNLEVELIADAKVDREKGTGLVMCCTFGDDTDKEWWETHRLPTRVILNKFGKLDEAALRAIGLTQDYVEALKNKKTSNADPKHPGAREIILAALQDAGLLQSQKPITHTVKTAERSGAPLEILPTHQWFVRVTDKKEALTARVRECQWKPEWMRLRIEQWIEGLNQDWCISRQRYFGVPFPVWYAREEGASDAHATLVYADAAQLPVNPLVDLPAGYEKLAQLEGLSCRARRVRDGAIVTLTPDLDVMDTWATSSISPQLSAGAISSDHRISGSPDHRFPKLFPADLRPQAHEIIRTWAFYTLVKAHLHNDSIPWHNLMISGWCLAEDKSKMSKSKGNVVTPVALIAERGSDAVRYWAATSRLGQDTAFSPDLLKIGKKLVGKLWNATQFAALHLAKLQHPAQTAAADVASGAITELYDRWILARLGETIAASTRAFDAYEYAEALEAANHFFWGDFCDNYLELVKKRVYNEDGTMAPAAQQSAVRTLYYVLEGILKLYAPFVPHVTEELYAHVFADAYAAAGSLHARGQWPQAENFPVMDASLRQAAQDGLKILAAIRKAKSDSNRSIKFPVAALSISATLADPTRWMGDVAAAGNVQTWRTDAAIPADAPEIVLPEHSDAA